MFRAWGFAIRMEAELYTFSRSQKKRTHPSLSIGDQQIQAISLVRQHHYPFATPPNPLCR
jgi:hypothetical protein